eukprot:scaffold53_cov193-Pinguiococcus_pyrenoidosus.AAC.36
MAGDESWTQQYPAQCGAESGVGERTCQSFCHVGCLNPPEAPERSGAKRPRSRFEDGGSFHLSLLSFLGSDGKKRDSGKPPDLPLHI